MEREELKEEGESSAFTRSTASWGKGTLLARRTPSLPKFVCLSFSCPFRSLWPHRWQADLRHEASEKDRELYLGLQISFLYINKKTQNYPKMTLLPSTSQSDLRRKQGLSCDAQGLGPAYCLGLSIYIFKFTVFLMLNNQGPTLLVTCGQA